MKSTRRSAASAHSWLEVNRQTQTPFYLQIYERLRAAITAGTLRPGERLPSARSLASQLATARGTVDAAYELLASQGYVVGRGAAGTIVAPTLANVLSSRRPAAPNTPSQKAPARKPDTVAAIAPKPFQLGLPAMDAFPRTVWSRLATRRARELTLIGMSYPDPFGYQPLREAIASYLAVARGFNCSPDSIVITGGYQSTLAMIARAVLKPGDDVWVEDPGYTDTSRALTMAGANLVPVSVDEHGLDVAAGVARSAHARFAVVTPSHQAPLGVTLDLPRRLSLLAWAIKAGSWVVEDDYDGEFRYDSKPLPALKSLDERDRVLYVGSFSKVMFPGLRLGYLVLPDSLVDTFARVRHILYRDGSIFIPSVVTDFMTGGHFARHVKRMRQLYAERRGALARALVDAFADRVNIELQAGGMQLIAHLGDGYNDVEVAKRANAQGLAVSPLSPRSVENHRGPALMLSFTNIPVERARREARRLQEAIAI
jgi:GntR family transcriptional regulator / MocR family aminotransferase